MVTPIKSHWVTGSVLENKVWTERLFSLRLKADDLLPFEAGQFVRLQLTVDGEAIDKSYSLVNAPNDPILEVFYNTVPDGKLSNALAALKAEDAIHISQPAAGFFTLTQLPTAKNLWMIATGTGLGPYLSMLQTEQAWKQFETITLVHGAPIKAELAYVDLITEIKEQHPAQFDFISCVSREANPEGLEGRVTTAMESGELEKLADRQISQEDSHVMLCGNHGMINDMKALLEQRGMKPHQRFQPGHYSIEQYF